MHGPPIVPMLVLFLLSLLVTIMASLEEAIGNVGTAVSVQQADFIPRISRHFKGKELLKVKLAFNLDSCWKLTLSPSVFPNKSNGKTSWRIRFRYRKSERQKYKLHTHKTRYDTERAAIDDLYFVRWNMESGQGQAEVDQVLKGDASFLVPPPQKRSAIDPDDARPKKQRSTMSYSLHNRLSAIPNRNPKGMGDMNPHSLVGLRAAAGRTITDYMTRRVLPFTSRQVRDRHIELLESGIRNNGEEWYRLIPHGEDEEVMAQASPKAVEKVKEQCKLVRKALCIYNVMVESKISAQSPQDSSEDSTWRKACVEAVNSELSSRNGQTVERWYIRFRCNDEQDLRFPLSKTGKASNEARCPFVVVNTNPNEPGGDAVNDVGFDYRDVKLQFEKWFRKEQKCMRAFIAAKWFTDKLEKLDLAHNGFLKQYNIPSPIISNHIASNWMAAMGVTYDKSNKCYFVANHEAPHALDQRKECIEWSFGIEKRMHCWINFTNDELAEFVKDKLGKRGAEIQNYVGKIKGQCVLSKRGTDGKVRYEYHVDSVASFHDVANERYEFGGTLSLDFGNDEKPVIVIGHDESSYSQNYFNGGGYALHGEKVLRSKGNGKTLMVSDFVCTELGLALRHYLDKLSPEERAAVVERCNRLYRTGKNYKNEAAAKEVNRHTRKEKFTVTCNPAHVIFESGKNEKGWWSSNHMMLQLEDVRDFLFSLFPDPADETQCKYDFYFELDRSSGHTIALENGLHPSNFNHPSFYPNSKKPVVRPTTIPIAEGYLGKFTHDHVITPHPTKKVIHKYLSNDPPPKFNRSNPPKVSYPSGNTRPRKLRKDELRTALIRNDPNYNRDIDKLKPLQQDSIAAGLPTSVEENVPVYGYVEEPIGMVELVWRRGFIDPAATKAPSKEECIKIMVGLTDFKEEKTKLQHIALDLGVNVVFTPICHCEIAGRGIEYVWGVSKLYYRKHNVGKGGEEMRKLVEESLERIDIGCIRRLARKAREYKLAYKQLIEDGEGKLTYACIEELKASLKQKRAMHEIKGASKDIRAEERRISEANN